MAATDVSQALQELETRLQDPAVRAQSEQVKGLLAEGFREFGSSGRVFSRSEMAQALAVESPVGFAMREFGVEMVTAEVALVTYRARRERAGYTAMSSLRSSLWRRREGGWEMVFHQGTKIDAAEGE